ncbi:MAG: hypothetical protein K2G44_03355 [Clostridia bacterium]|nr:hypothetical protein [Clostridia bacterium]
MAFIEECLELKKATFYSDKIVLHKRKGDITIMLKEVDRFDYTKPSFMSFLLAGLCSTGASPGYLLITLKKPHTGKKGAYYMRLKYDDYCRLPSDYSMKMNYSSS